jgi:hypothetical protein
MTKLTKVLLGLGAALAVVSATGCCLPLHGGHHGGRWDRQSRGYERERPAPPARPPQDPRWR